MQLRLVFRIKDRPTGFSGATVCGRMRAVFDLLVQWIIFVSLDIVPIAYACSSINLTELVTLGWHTRLATVAIVVAGCHTAVYYVWCCVMDLVLKVCTGYQLYLQVYSSRANHMRHRVGATYHRTTIRAMLEDITENTLGVSAERGQVMSKQSRRDDWLNMCVCVRNCLSTRFIQCLLLLSAVGGLAATVIVSVRKEGHGRSSWLYIFIVSVLVLCLLMRYRMGAARERAAVEFQQHVHQRGELTGVWALWFRTNCGLRPYALRSKAFVALLVSAVLLAGGVHYTLPTLFFIGGCSGCWACLVIFMSLCLPSHLWKLIMLQLPLFIGVTLVAQHWFLGSLGIEICAALIVLTQCGLSRETGERYPRQLSEYAFIAVVMVLAVVTFVSASVDDGAPLSQKGDFPWCDAADPTCKNFTFPVGGSRSPYAFCGLAWPMGADQSAQNVSQTCADTKLSIVDFAQMSKISYSMPHMGDTR